MIITAYEAIEFKKRNPESRLRKYADPTENARDISVEEAEEIATEDPSLIYISD